MRKLLLNLIDKHHNIFIPFVIVWTFGIMSIYGIYYGIEYLCKYIRKYYYVEKNYLKALIGIAVSAFLLRLVWECFNSLVICICEWFDIRFYTAAYIICFIAFISFSVSFEVKAVREQEENEE